MAGISYIGSPIRAPIPNEPEFHITYSTNPFETDIASIIPTAQFDVRNTTAQFSSP